MSKTSDYILRAALIVGTFIAITLFLQNAPWRGC